MGVRSRGLGGTVYDAANRQVGEVGGVLVGLDPSDEAAPAGAAGFATVIPPR